MLETRSARSARSTILGTQNRRSLEHPLGLSTSMNMEQKISENKKLLAKSRALKKPRQVEVINDYQ